MKVLYNVKNGKVSSEGLYVILFAINFAKREDNGHWALQCCILEIKS